MISPKPVKTARGNLASRGDKRVPKKMLPHGRAASDVDSSQCIRRIQKGCTTKGRWISLKDEKKRREKESLVNIISMRTVKVKVRRMQGTKNTCGSEALWPWGSHVTKYRGPKRGKRRSSKGRFEEKSKRNSCANECKHMRKAERMSEEGGQGKNVHRNTYGWGKRTANYNSKRVNFRSPDRIMGGGGGGWDTYPELNRKPFKTTSARNCNRRGRKGIHFRGSRKSTGPRGRIPPMKGLESK